MADRGFLREWIECIKLELRLGMRYRTEDGGYDGWRGEELGRIRHYWRVVVATENRDA